MEKNAIQKLLEVFSPRERKQAWIIFVFTILAGLTQSIGVLSVLPFMNVVLDYEVIFNQPILFAIYNFLGLTRAFHFLIILGGFVFLALLASNLMGALTIWAKTRFVNRQNHRMSVKLLSKYMTQPYEFFLSRNSNELSKNILAEVAMLTSGYLMSLMEIFTGGFILLFILITILVVDFTASMIALVIFGSLYGTIMLYLRKKLRRRGELARVENEKKYRYTYEGLNSFKTTKVIHAEPYYIGEYRQASEAFARHNTFAAVASAMPRFLVEVIAVGGLMLFVMVQLALSRELEQLAPVVAVLGLAGYRMLPALQTVFQNLTSLQYTRPVLDRLYEDLVDVSSVSLAEMDEELNSQDLAPHPFTKSIALENARFQYRNTESDVLKGISVTIKKHQVVGFVGETGSGKTTMIDVLMGLLHLEGGHMAIDGEPLNRKQLKAWQKNIGYVPQEIFLTDDTISQNIAFGINKKDIDLTRVQEAARLASIDRFIEEELPLKYDTIVGERGVRLSGGQRQRIGIARALYRNPQVLILDEATSALDGTTEEAVLSAIGAAAKERTVIMVAHRLNTLMDCDVIYILEKGTIVDSGTYHSLLENNETFQRMAKSYTEKDT